MRKSNDTTFGLMFEFGRLIRSRMAPAPCSLPQLEALHFVADHERRPTMRELATHLKVKAPTATALVDELVRTGYLERAPEAADRRRVTLGLTAAGRRMFKDSVERRVRVIESVLEPLSHKDREAFNRVLHIIVSSQRN